MMKTLLFGLLLLCSTAVAAAEMVLVTEDIVIVLQDTPCDNAAVLSLLQPDKHEFYQNGVATFITEKRAFCWRVSSDNQFIWIIDEMGEAPPGIPVMMFAPAQGI